MWKYHLTGHQFVLVPWYLCPGTKCEHCLSQLDNPHYTTRHLQGKPIASTIVCFKDIFRPACITRAVSLVFEIAFDVVVPPSQDCAKCSTVMSYTMYYFGRRLDCFIPLL